MTPTLPERLRAEAEKFSDPLLSYLDHQTAALLREAAEAVEWRPIESAPKDGTAVLGFGVCAGYAPAQAQVIKIRPDETEGYWRRHDGFRVKATHWQPLPAPPIDAAGG